MTYAEMVYNKEQWNQTEGRQGEHFVISFPKDEVVDENTACQFAEDFCRELLHGEYIHAWAVHVDRDHTHIHLCFDHTNIKTGKKIHFGKYSWLAELQPLVDKVCQKYKLRTLDFDPQNRSERQNKYHQEWEAEKDNLFKAKKNVSWTDIIRADVDIALSKSNTWTEFLQTLRDMHYEIKDGQHLSLRPEGKERFTRSGRRGEEYTKEHLLHRLGEQPKFESTYGDPEILLRTLREYLQKNGQSELKGIKVIYFQRWYAYSYVNRSKVAYRYRKELTELGRYTDRCAYLFKHDITTVDELQKHLQGLQTRQIDIRKELIRTQNQIYNTPLSEWRKLEKLRAKSDSVSEIERPAIEKQIQKIVQKLKDQDIVADSEKYRTLQDRKTVLQSEQAKRRAEIKMATDLISDFDKTKMPGDIMFNPDRYIPRPFNDQCYRRITINKVLFLNTPEGSDYYRFRIPGRNESLLIYKDDTRMADDSSYASCYIYDHLKYKVIGHENNFIEKIPGIKVVKYFTDRTREKVR